MNHGIYVTGRLLGINQREWQDKIFHRLGLGVEFKGQYGELQTETLNVSIPQDRVMEVQQFLNNNINKQVVIQVRIEAKQGRNGAFLNYSMNKDSSLEIVEEKKKAA